MTTSTPEDPRQQQPAEAPETGEVEEIDERDQTPPREIVQPEFDDDGDGEPGQS